VYEKVGDGKFFIAKGIVTTFHCASLKYPTWRIHSNRNHGHNAHTNNLKKKIIIGHHVQVFKTAY
jgi:hypothetical protein